MSPNHVHVLKTHVLKHRKKKKLTTPLPKHVIKKEYALLSPMFQEENFVK